MKKLHKYILLVIGLVAFTACTDDNEFPNTGTKDDDVSLQLNFQSQTNKEVINSRATAEENKLYDLHFYVFNAEGKLTGYEKLVSETGDIPTPGLEKVNIRTKTGESYIYAVANINKSYTYFLNDADKALLNVTPDATSTMNDEALKVVVDNSTLTRDALLKMNFAREVGSENAMVRPDPSNNVFMMSGYLNDGNSVNIQLNGNSVTVDADNIIKLYRILAKNTLTITSNGNAGTFTPKSYRLCNVPVEGVLMPKAGISNVTTYTNGNVTNAGVESSYHWNFEGNSTISFYYPENLQTVKDGKTCTEWKDRESNNWSSGTKVYTHAADKAAYIEIYGDYVNSTGKVTANVTYTIHFGDFSSTNIDAETKNRIFTDFNVIRNHEYIYEVTVNGVDDIKVEATTETNQDNPYAEGLIVDATGGSHYDVDAHYEARVMTFKKSSIEALKAAYNKAGTGYILNINTPFGAISQTVNVRNDGVYTMDNQQICTIAEATDIDNPNYTTIKEALFGKKEADFRWMRFVRNTEGNVTKDGNDISLYTCKYPGDTKNKYSYSVNDKGTIVRELANEGGWMNVFELLAELYYTDDDADTDNDITDNDIYSSDEEEVYYTCFIDEYYYYNKLWKDYVDKNPRTMLIANDLAVSTDGKSLYAQVAYSISQRSISTFYVNDYKPDGENLVKAFGTEIIDEEDKYNNRISKNSTGITTTNQTDWNAWTSAYKTNNDAPWYSTDITHKSGIQPLYSSIAKACMSRNRDNDGDGKIDADEVRWYLAAVEQYRALFYGRNSLDPDAYLISNEELEDIDSDSGRGKYHYFTCSSNTSSNQLSVFWPEEGLSTSHFTRWQNDAQLVRCIRTLDSGTSEQAAYGLQDPEPFYTYQDNTFHLDGIKQTRNYIEEPLKNHNEIQDLNNLYNSFIVASNDLTKDIPSLVDITNQNGTGGNTKDPCSNYSEDNYSWRTPNQKEFALMLSEIDDLSSGSYAMRTKFSGGGDSGWKNTYGFYSYNGRINLDTYYVNNLKVRCVRDNKQESE